VSLHVGAASVVAATSSAGGAAISWLCVTHMLLSCPGACFRCDLCHGQGG
jgi:hypothetical protein